MPAITIAIAAIVVTAFAAIANSLAGMITAESIAAAIAIGAAMVRATATTADTAAVATAVATTISAAAAAAAAAATATTATTAATATLRIGSVHDREISREERGGCEHHGAGHDSNETLVF